MVRIARGTTELELYFKGGDTCLFEKESFVCKTRQNLSINCDAIESLSLEITNEK